MLLTKPQPIEASAQLRGLLGEQRCHLVPSDGTSLGEAFERDDGEILVAACGAVQRRQVPRGKRDYRAGLALERAR